MPIERVPIINYRYISMFSDQQVWEATESTLRDRPLGLRN